MTSGGNSFKDFLLDHFTAKMLLHTCHTRSIPATHLLFPTAHFVSENTILGPEESI